MTQYTENDLIGPLGKGSSHKQMYDIREEPDFCFVAIAKKDEKDLDHELKNYELLKTYGVRIPIFGGKQPIRIKEADYVGIKMEKLKGIEYKQTLTWIFVKKQIDKWETNKKERIQNLFRTIDAFLNSGVSVTDLQVFILETTGEMVVFDSSTAGKAMKKPKYPELEDIKAKLDAELKKM